MTIHSLDVLLFLFGTVCSSMSISNCCFLTCIQVSQEVGKVVWYSHLFQNVPQFIVIHTVKGFGVVNKAEIDVFLEFSCLFFSLIYFFLISWRLITLQYCSGFCHTLTWISLGYTCIPHPDPPSHLPLHTIPLAFFMIQRMFAIWSLVPLPFLKPASMSGSSQFMYSLAEF